MISISSFDDIVHMYFLYCECEVCNFYKTLTIDIQCTVCNGGTGNRECAVVK